MKKILKKISGESRIFSAKSVEKSQSDQNHRKELEARVDAGLQKAVKEYRETFRILANYDRS